MLQLNRITKGINGIEFELLCDENNEKYFTEANLELAFKLGERSIRDFLVNKSPQAARCKGSLSGKNGRIKGYNKSVKVWDLVVVENFIEYHAFKGNIYAQALMGTYNSVGLRTWVNTAFGETVTQEQVNHWQQLRDCEREDYQPLLCVWHKHDSTTIPYGGFVQNFKRAAKIPLVHPDEMKNPVDIKRYGDMIRAYDLLRKLGNTDKQARTLLTQLY